MLGAGVAMVVWVGVWYALDAYAWRTFEDGHGPVRAVAVFALALPLSLLAWRRPILGGGLLLAVSLVPGVLALLAAGGGVGGSTVAVTSPVALIGVLFLCSGLAGPGTEQRR